MELATIGSLVVSYLFVYAVAKSDKNIDDEIDDPGEEESEIGVDKGRTVTMSCQTCRKLTRHQEIKPNLYQCRKCKRHVDIR